MLLTLHNIPAETATAETGYEISTDDNTWYSDTSIAITPGGTLYVRRAETTGSDPVSESEATKNTLASRPNAPTLTIDNENESVTISSDYYYNTSSSDYTDNGWVQGTEAAVTVDAEASIYIYTAATDSTFKSEVQTLTAPSRATEPSVTIDYTEEKLSTSTDMEYYYGSGWVTCTADMDATAFGWDGTSAVTVLFRTAATNSNYASEAISVEIPVRPSVPDGVVGVNEQWLDEADGQITNVSTEMEYQADGDTDWTACIGTTIEDLAVGDYYVRYAATESAFAGNLLKVTIASGKERTYTLTVTAPGFETAVDGYAQPDAESIKITNSGNSDATIESVKVDYEDDFTIGGSGDTVPTGGSIDTWTIQPAEGLSIGTHTATITVTYNEDAKAEATVTFIVVAKTYTLTVDLDGGSGDTDGGVYEEGTEIDIDAGSRSNYTFTGWTSSDGGTFGDASSASTTFIMPASDTTITANWQKKSSSSSGGSSHSLEQVISSSSSDDSDDDEDTATDTTTDATDVTDTTVDTTTTDTTADTPVIGSGDAAGTDVSDDAVFIDVSTSDPYYDAVMTAYENGLMVGIGDRLFAPDMHLTRAMAAQVIWNMAGTPGANDVAPFLDVTSDTWYAEAVTWCYENGIVVGYDDITYGPDDYLTEEQFERMLDIYKGLNPADYTGISDNATRSWVATKITE